MGMARGIILGTPGLRSHEALLKDLQHGWERVVPISDLISVIESLEDQSSSGQASSLMGGNSGSGHS
jgi:predicted Abi (CAAX) family protease